MPHANSTYALTAKWRDAGGEQHERRLGPLDAASSGRRAGRGWRPRATGGIETGDVDLAQMHGQHSMFVENILHVVVL
jgi:hypothetical protein